MSILVPLASVVLSLSIPIVVIVWNVKEKIARKKMEKELRDHIIDNNVDMEMARLLIAESQPKKSKVGVLRWGLALLGLGIGILLSNAIPVIHASEDVIMVCMAALGIGVGLFLSFIIEMLFDKKLNPREEEAKENKPE